MQILFLFLQSRLLQEWEWAWRHINKSIPCVLRHLEYIYRNLYEATHFKKKLLLNHRFPMMPLTFPAEYECMHAWTAFGKSPRGLLMLNSTHDTASVQDLFQSSSCNGRQQFIAAVVDSFLLTGG